MKTVAASDPECIDQALAVLCQGGLVAYPTDTIYGLGALATDDAAVRCLFAVKGRELDKALPLLLADAVQAEASAEMTPLARELMAAFWPGALTIVLRRRTEFRSLALAGGDTIALRVPDQPLVRELIRRFGAPLTGTSANRSGGASPLTADEVARQLADEIDLLIDGGPCPGGVESTVVDATGAVPRLLRKGALAWQSIAAVASRAASR
ncbi:MAG TPA: L-threonylcarbamoyladenylate synthase [Dehalococcoidia bacterium]|nr:L-threonylcarbamoyladenylate synthase [Dehalococcoidia bacterium]